MEQIKESIPEWSFNGNFDLLRHLIGEESTASNIQIRFPLEQLDRHENFLSLLYYFGLLSIRDVSYGVTRLGIPNQTVKRLMTWVVPSPGASSGTA